MINAFRVLGKRSSWRNDIVIVEKPNRINGSHWEDGAASLNFIKEFMHWKRFWEMCTQAITFIVEGIIAVLTSIFD